MIYFVSAVFLFIIERAEALMKKITVAEQTLKMLAENGKTPLLFREKTAIASCIDKYGADIIELGQVKKSREDTIVFRTIASVAANSAVCVTAGTDEESIKNAWECVKDAKKPVLQIELPVSAVTMEYTYHAKDDKMAAMIESAVSKARYYCETVEFSAKDATRADPEFLKRAVTTAVNAGASFVTLCDDEGESLPDEIADMVKSVISVCERPVFVKPSNKLAMATACALYAVKAGASGIKSTVSGKDALSTAAFAEVMRSQGEKNSIECSLKMTEIKHDIKELVKTVGRPIDEPMQDETNRGEDIYLDSSSTLAQVSDAAKRLGYTLSANDDGEVYKALKRVCEKKNAVGGKELEAIIASSAMQAPSVYHLESYNFTSGNKSGAMASITLTKNDEKLIGAAVGDGPIDASFKAIEQCIGFHYELDAFRIQAVTEGKEALGAALVRLRNDGRVYSGNGLSTDIVGSSIRAYINALNKIASEEENS